MPQFKKSIIIWLVAEEEKTAYNYGLRLPGTLALAKKTAAEEIIHFDPRKPFTGKQTLLMSVTPEELPTVRFIIRGHSSEGSQLLLSVDFKAEIHAKQLAKFFSIALGPIATSRESPLHISLIACMGHTFGKYFQQELLANDIYSTIKVRMSFVQVEPDGTKVTLDEESIDGKLEHRMPHSKTILYVDQNNKPQELKYDSSKKSVYVLSYLKTTLEMTDGRALQDYLTFVTAKYGRISDEEAKTALHRAIDCKQEEAVMHLLNTEYIRANLTTLLAKEYYEKLLQLVENNTEIEKKAAAENYTHVVKFLDLCKIATLVHKKFEALEFKLSSDQMISCIADFKRAYQQKGPDSFVRAYVEKGAIKNLLFLGDNNLTQLMSMTLEKKSTEKVHAVFGKHYPYFLTHGKTKDASMFTWACREGRQHPNGEFITGLMTAPFFERLKCYIKEHKFNPSDSSYVIDLGRSTQKKVPRIVHEQWKILMASEGKATNADLFKILKIMEQPAKKSIFSLFGSDVRPPETEQYIKNVSEGLIFSPAEEKEIATSKLDKAA